jgi:hypothetical protein
MIIAPAIKTWLSFYAWGAMSGELFYIFFKGQDVKVPFKSAQKECNKTRKNVHDVKRVHDLK